jgi:hypothetical protein
MTSGHERYLVEAYVQKSDMREAASEEAVREVCRRAGIGPGRIVRAVE